MCVYNGEAHLKEAIDSILCQTFTDFEYIIVDDGSNDNTPQILANYAQKDSRIRIVRNEINLGLEASLNKGISFARGKYFARQDADDISLPHRFKQQIHYLEKHPQVGAIGTAVELIDSKGNMTGEDHPPTAHESLEALFMFNNCMHHSTLMARQHLIEKIGGYDETKRRAEDYDLWWRLSRQARLENLPDVLLKRRLDDGPRISILHREKQLDCSYQIALSATRENIGDTFAIPEESYQRLWWALLQTVDHGSYQRYWLAVRGKSSELTIKDIQDLNPFWNFIKKHPGGPVIWGPLLEGLVCRLFIQKKTVEALKLLYIIYFQLQKNVHQLTISKCFIKPYFPTVILQVLRNLRLQTSES